MSSGDGEGSRSVPEDRGGHPGPAPGQYPPPDQSGGYPPPGQPGDYPPAGRPGDYPAGQPAGYQRPDQPGAYPPPAGLGPYDQAPAPTSAGNGLSIAAIVLGAIALLFVPILFGIAGVICGIIAMRRNEPLAKVGLGVAIAGLVLGLVIGAIVGVYVFGA